MKLSSPEKNAALLKVTSWTKFSKYFQCPYLSPLLCWGWCSRKLLLTQQIHWTRGQLLTLHPNLGELCHPLKAMNLKTFVHIDCKSKLHKAFRPIESHTSRAIHQEIMPYIESHTSIPSLSTVVLHAPCILQAFISQWKNTMDPTAWSFSEKFISFSKAFQNICWTDL